MGGPPKVTVGIHLDSSGIIQVKNPLVSIEESYWKNVTTKKAKNVTGDTSVTNDTNSTSGTEAKAETEVEGEETSKDDGEKSNSTENSTGNTTAAEEEVEITQKLKKKKHEKKLQVNRQDFKPLPLTADGIAEAKKRLETMRETEALAKELDSLKNELEAGIYAARDRLESDTVIKVSTDGQREEITKMCTEVEEWLYEGSNAKTDYEQKLTGLRNLLGPIEERAQELEKREELPEMVKDVLEKADEAKKHIQKKMDWVNPNKTEAMITKQKEFEEWWSKRQDLQKKLPLHEAPAFTAAEAQSKIKEIEKGWEKLKNTKKPKEKKEKKAKDNETKKGDAKKTEEEEAKPLPTDPAEVEKELEEIRKQKADAVEEEDYDKAFTLKQREKDLKAHLATLKPDGDGKAEL